MLDDYQKLVTALVRDQDDLLSEDDINLAIGFAITRYSSDRPKTELSEQEVNNNITDLPDNWIANFSRVAGVEYPAGLVPPSFIPIARTSIYEGLSGQKIMLSGINDGSIVRLHYTSLHKVTETIDTITISDREAVANWAAALLLDQLANSFAGDTYSTIQADTIDHANKSRDYGSRAKYCRSNYFNHLGIDNKRNAAAGTVVTIQSTDSVGCDRLLHYQNRRRP
ncbi:MAG: hypothetical protein AB7U85_04905 [Alphaproteobacteria bacterium]